MRQISRSSFWEKVCRSTDLCSIDVGTCTRTLKLSELANALDIRYKSAPHLISIDTYEDLPWILKRNGLVVIRLGQYGRGTATLTICRIGRNELDLRSKYVLPPLQSINKDQVIYYPLRNFVRNIMNESVLLQLSLNAISSTIYLVDIRLGRASFLIEPVYGFQYRYDGQVEADGLFILDHYYHGVEAKSNKHILLHELALISQALAEKIKEPVKPVYAYIDPGKLYTTLYILSPPAYPGKPYKISSMKLEQSVQITFQ